MLRTRSPVNGGPTGGKLGPWKACFSSRYWNPDLPTSGLSTMRWTDLLLCVLPIMRSVHYTSKWPQSATTQTVTKRNLFSSNWSFLGILSWGQRARRRDANFDQRHGLFSHSNRGKERRDKVQGETTERTHSRGECGFWEALMLRCQISKITFWEKTARAKIYTWFRQGVKTAQGTTTMQLLTNTFLITVLTSLKISIPYTHTLRGEIDCRESKPCQSFSMYVSVSSKAKQNKTPWILSKDNDRSGGRVNKTLVVGGGDWALAQPVNCLLYNMETWI